MLAEQSVEDYKKAEKAIVKKISEIAKASGSESAKALVKEKKYEKDEERMKNCRIVRMLVNESLDLYEDGDMDLKEMIEDLYQALKAV